MSIPIWLQEMREKELLQEKLRKQIEKALEGQRTPEQEDIIKHLRRKK